MNETTQTQINLGDYNKPQEQTKAIGIGKILGKIINIKDFRTNRGNMFQDAYSGIVVVPTIYKTCEKQNFFIFQHYITPRRV
jgi:hypothetical protein